MGGGQKNLNLEEVVLCPTWSLLLQLTCRSSFHYIVEKGANGMHFIILHEGMRLDWSRQ